MTSQPGEQTIAIHILPDISRSKGNQAMKFRQLKEDSIPADMRTFKRYSMNIHNRSEHS